MKPVDHVAAVEQPVLHGQVAEAATAGRDRQPRRGRLPPRCRAGRTQPPTVGALRVLQSLTPRA